MNTATQELRALVEQIRETLWPGGDLAAEWNADTVEAISFAFEQHRPDLIPPDYYDRAPYSTDEVPA
jgi:hypothetical protein